MRKELQRLREPSRRCLTRKVAAVTVAAFFFFHLIRFYLVAPLDVLECFEPNFRHQGIFALENHSHHHGEVGTAPPSDDAGYALQHCKDTYNGIGLTPVQPLGLPVAVSQEFLGLALSAGLCEPCQPMDHFLSPPFQPPRHLG